MHFNSKPMSAVLMAVTCAVAAVAAPLSPNQALSAALGKDSAKLMKAPAKQYQLALTVNQPGSTVPGVYVFAPAEGAGFVVAAADDAAAPLIGYSDESSFDAANIPPSMQWLLDSYAASIAAAAKAPARQPITPANLARQRLKLLVADADLEQVTLNGNIRHRAPAKDIAKLCATTWDQDAPYYNQCPLISNQRAYTGCVATALAQVCKFWGYPTKGSGSKSYSFTYNGRSYSDSFNFANTTFDYANMLNSYSGSYNSTQANAVASLMHACGVASEMSYGLDGSGANSFDTGYGLYTYLKYDKSIEYQTRDWYDTEAWTNLVYDEMAQGHPVVFTAFNVSQEGHCFILDGYAKSSGFFHVNWGWGGVADGYFDVSNLDPYTQGIGGGSGSSGFNYGQGIYINLKPSEGTSSITPKLAYDTGISTQQSSYNRNSSTRVSFNNVFYSYALGTVNYTIALSLTNTSTGAVSYVNVMTQSLEMANGLSGFNVTSTSFPVGDYEVEAVYRSASTQPWKPFTACQGYPSKLHFEVTSSKINITAASSGEVPEGEVTVEINNYTPDVSSDTDIYSGHGYTFNYNMTSTGKYSGDTYCVIINSSYNILAKSDAVNVQFDKAETKPVSYHVSIPSSVAAGDYYICVIDADYYILDNIYRISVAEAPTTVTVDADFSVEEKDIFGAIFTKTGTYDIVWDVTTTGAWSGTVVNSLLSVGSDGKLYIEVLGDEHALSFKRAGTQSVTDTMTIPADLDVEDTYAMALLEKSASGYTVIRGYYVDINECPDPAVTLVGASIGEDELSADKSNQIDRDGCEITFDIHCVYGPWNHGLEISIVDGDNKQVALYQAAAQATLGHNTDSSVSVNIPQKAIVDDQIHSMIVTDSASGKKLAAYDIFMHDTSGVGLNAADADDANTRYFNLQGVRIDNPVPGEFYLKVPANAPAKVIRN